MEYDNVSDAKRSVKKQIDFLENLLKHLKNPDKGWRVYAVVTAWCINRYFSEKLTHEIQEVMTKNVAPENKVDA
jgi:hypothetical protein